MRFGIVDSQSLLVVNVCEWDGAEWLPPFGTFIVQAPRIDIGDSYDPVKDVVIPLDRTAKDE